MNPTQIDQKIREFIWQSGIDFSKLGQVMGHSAKDLFRWWNQPGQSYLSQRNIENLAYFLNLTAEQLVAGLYQLDQVRSKFIVGPTFENEKYHQEAYSKVRTSAHIIRFLCFRIGRNKTDSLLREMGVHPCIYTHFDNQISIDFFVDLLHQLEKLGLSHEEIDHLSCYMFLALEGTPLGQLFAQAQTYYDCYNVISTSYGYFDSNFHYKLDLDDRGFRFFAYPGESLKKKMKEGKIDCTRLAMYRKTMLGWFPYLSGLAPLNVRMTKSIAHGDDYCFMEGDFPSPPLTPKVRSKPQLVSVL